MLKLFKNLLTLDMINNHCFTLMKISFILYILFFDNFQESENLNIFCYTLDLYLKCFLKKSIHFVIIDLWKSLFFCFVIFH